MKTKLLLLIFGIFLLSSATAIYAGETLVVEHNLGTDKLIWTIVDNSSEITVLPEVTFNVSHITIHFKAETPPQSFILVFMIEDTKEVIKEVYISSGGGGGHSTRTIVEEVIKEVPNYVTQYVENKTTEYVDREIIVDKEKSILIIVLLILGSIFIIVEFMIYIKFQSNKKHYSKEHIDERRFEEE